MHWSSPLIIEPEDVYIFAHIWDYNSTVQIKLKILMVKPHFFSLKIIGLTMYLRLIKKKNWSFYLMKNKIWNAPIVIS